MRLLICGHTHRTWSIVPLNKSRLAFEVCFLEWNQGDTFWNWSCWLGPRSATETKKSSQPFAAHTPGWIPQSVLLHRWVLCSAIPLFQERSKNADVVFCLGRDASCFHIRLKMMHRYIKHVWFFYDPLQCTGNQCVFKSIPSLSKALILLLYVGKQQQMSSSV